MHDARHALRHPRRVRQPDDRNRRRCQSTAGALADIEEVDGPEQITHESVKLEEVVQSDVEDSDVEDDFQALARCGLRFGGARYFLDQHRKKQGRL